MVRHSVLGRVIRFAENLQVGRIDNLIEKQAAELIDELDKVFTVELKVYVKCDILFINH